MQEFLTTYWPYLAGGGLVSLFKIGDKPIWKQIKDVIVKPKTPPSTDKTDPTASSFSLLTLLPLLVPLITQLSKKKPVVTVETPPNLTTLPSDPAKLIDWLLKLLSSPEQPAAPTIDEPHAPHPALVDKGDVAYLLGCANAVALAHPNSDVVITIDNKGVIAKVTPRVESK